MSLSKNMINKILLWLLAKHLDEERYLHKMENHLNETIKFEKVNLKNDGILGFAFNQEKRGDDTLKKLVASNSTSEETRRSLKLIGTKPGIMYRLCKVHNNVVGNCPPF